MRCIVKSNRTIQERRRMRVKVTEGGGGGGSVSLPRGLMAESL